MLYRFINSSLDEHRYLAVLSNFFTSQSLQLWVPSSMEEPSRIEMDGFVMAVGEVGGKRMGVVYNDFRVNGGSFGRTVTQRLRAFIAELGRSKTPLVFAVNSIGFRLMEGRISFDDAFRLVPDLLAYSRENALYTISIGRTLGLGALVLRMGAYRVGVDGVSDINLTGPEVIKLFFGESVDFKEVASCRHHMANGSMVSESFPSVALAFNRLRDMALMQERNLQPAFALADPSSFDQTESARIFHRFQKKAHEKLETLLNGFAESALEVFPQLDQVVRTFLVRVQGRLVGVFVNPPGNPQNLISSATLHRYHEALALFKAMRLPIVSFLDTAGVDPRSKSSSGQDVISALTQVSADIIEYPFPKMGFFMGRCFGGANVLGFPKTFGSEHSYGLHGCRLGIMHPEILSKILGGSPRLLEKWEVQRESESEDLRDFIEGGFINGWISHDAIPGAFARFLGEIDSMERTA